MGIGILSGFGVKTYIRTRGGLGTVSNPLVTELEGLVSDIKNILANAGGVATPSDPITRIPTIDVSTTSGTIAAGAKSVVIANTGSASGVILGKTVPSGMSVGFDAGLDILDAVTYNATGTTFMIVEVR